MRYIVKTNDSHYLWADENDDGMDFSVRMPDMHDATLFESEADAIEMATEIGLKRNEFELIAVQLVICPPTQTTLPLGEQE